MPFRLPREREPGPLQHLPIGQVGGERTRAHLAQRALDYLMTLLVEGTHSQLVALTFSLEVPNWFSSHTVAPPASSSPGSRADALSG